MWIAACSPVPIRKRGSGASVTEEGTLPTGKATAELEHYNKLFPSSNHFVMWMFATYTHLSCWTDGKKKKKKCALSLHFWLPSERFYPRFRGEQIGFIPRWVPWPEWNRTGYSYFLGRRLVLTESLLCQTGLVLSPSTFITVLRAKFYLA